VILITASVADSDAIGDAGMVLFFIFDFRRFARDADVIEVVQVLFSHKHIALRLTSLYKPSLISLQMSLFRCRNAIYAFYGILIESFYQKL
jgi:hypothetical protein